MTTNTAHTINICIEIVAPCYLYASPPKLVDDISPICISLNVDVIGFKANKVDVDLINLNTEIVDPLPFIYNSNHTVQMVALCCRDDGDWSQAISLPTPAPFMLLQVRFYSHSKIEYDDILHGL